MKLRQKLLCLTAIAMLTSIMVGCSTWERITFQTLAASKAVIDQAQVDYEGGTILQHSMVVYKTINDAKNVQKTAVDAMVVYEQIKATNGTASTLANQEAIVNVALASLPTLIADVKALYTSSAATPANASLLHQQSIESPSAAPRKPSTIKEPN